MKTFMKWVQAQTAALQRQIDEAVRHHMIGPSWEGDNIPLLKSKDAIGTPEMSMPGYRKGDIVKVKEESHDVAQMVDEATKHLGIHWLIMYIEPERGTRETPSDWLWKMYRDPQNDWKKYEKYARQTAQGALDDFVAGKEGGAHTFGDAGSADGIQKPANPENTIVYVKPTSRVHQLSAWQQMHNIGHAVWQSNKPQLSKFVKKLRDVVYELQQAQYDKDGTKPNAWEILITLGRALDLKSYQRVFAMQPGDMMQGEKRANSAFNNFMEGMIDLIAAYLNNKGKLPLHPRGEVIGGEKRVNRFGRRSYTLATPDRRGQMEPNPEIQGGKWTAAAKQRAGTFPGASHFGTDGGEPPTDPLKPPTRDWAWKPMNLDAHAWEIASAGLTSIIEEAISNCVWAKKGGPVYSTEGYITTKP